MLLIACFILILTHLSDAREFKGESESTNESLMKMVDNEWMDKFIPRQYKKEHTLPGSDQDVTKDNNFGFSEQGMKDLDEVGGLVGGGDSDLLGILRPYYSMVEMTANGNKQGMGQYLHVLPDSSEGDTPIYSVGGSMYGGVEPAGAKLGYMNRPFGKKR
ncbi:hypothetical protein GCK72_018082 [Caenorhabditis remanei]|uniref:Uncharacterized protein n=1 Tax=Caenorhabditis remanei TaxID=31234 RepID=A0A6A5G8V3_CAERE|nr:hypothetical protein GCK72_018082 [Caenorhabditis remanei]KAF1751528.1 hypothetical protein GCK72_018082 [Caenorhabditis remanei]